MGLFGNSGEKIMSRGTQCSGRITGIHVSYSSENESTVRRDDYAVSIEGGATVGVRQRLSPEDVVRLGMPVVIRLHDGDIVIDWAATTAAMGLHGETDLHRWKALKNPPAPGIVDEYGPLETAQKKGVAVSVTVQTIRERSVVFGLATVTDFEAVVRLAGEEPYGAELKKVEVPFYAGHLAVEGAELPGWVREKRLDKVVIDWPAAALRNPGVGAPSAVAKEAPAATSAVSVGDGASVREQVDGAGDGVVIGGITMSTLVAIQVGLMRDRVPPNGYDEYAQRFGVAPGTWAAVDGAWQQHFRTDWRIGAAYGEAYEAAMKGK